MCRINVGNIVVIGGDSYSEAVKWAEYNGNHGLWTGFKVSKVLEIGCFKVVGCSIEVPLENVHIIFETKEDYLAWLVEEFESNHSEEELEIFDGDYSDFIME